jgi:hypothetical protein
MLLRRSAWMMPLAAALALGAAACADLSCPHEISVVKPAPPRPAESAAPAAPHPAKAD